MHNNLYSALYASADLPRYIDTFEDEEPVDITAVSNALKTLDKDMQATDDAISGYCRELGIDSPF